MGELNIFPEKIVKTKDSNGNKYHSEVYTLEALANLNLFGILAICLIAGAILPFIPIVFLLLYCLTAKDQDTKTGFVLTGLLMSLYLILDISNGWLISKLIALAYGNKFKIIMPLSITTAIIGFMLLLFGKPLYDLTKRNLTLSFTVAILFFITYGIIKGIVK